MTHLTFYEMRAIFYNDSKVNGMHNEKSLYTGEHRLISGANTPLPQVNPQSKKCGTCLPY